MADILLVEDAIELADRVARELSAEGYRVLRAADGVAALQLFGASKPDLVILDWMLPGLDGLEVLRRIRQDPDCAVPVLMLTARSEETDRVVGLELGADDYLTKPFGMRELIARVRALLRRVQRIQSLIHADRIDDETEIQYGPFHLIPAGFHADCGGETLALTRTEFKLLHLMLRNPGRVFSREYLIDSVWGEQHVPGDRSVDNTVSRLRKKIGGPADAIESVWGVGYRLRPLE
ncbi:MAG: response regulator transcription factor [Anaerolineales bacterium]|nr:response regulator transcription factor [Anaerolineales bacterium]